MEWALNEYTFRECCGEEIRACDDCSCYTCNRCGENNYDASHPDAEDVCFECFLIEKEYRDEEIDS
tara:strand:- start:4135 stop:4332 length:198 start_codon:yes stop_codon:yes gene_type:complete